MKKNPGSLVIKALGGVRPAARILNRDHVSVINWRLRGRVPLALHDDILAYCKKNHLRMSKRDLMIGHD